MRRLLLASCIALATLSGCASGGGVSPSPAPDIAAVLAAPTRSAEDKERDARDKPAEVLALAGFKAGDTVADILAGSGYYSEILSGIVGPQGQVLLGNDERYDALGKEGYTQRLSELGAGRPHAVGRGQGARCARQAGRSAGAGRVQGRRHRGRHPGRQRLLQRDPVGHRRAAGPGAAGER